MNGGELQPFLEPEHPPLSELMLNLMSKASEFFSDWLELLLPELIFSSFICFIRVNEKDCDFRFEKTCIVVKWWPNFYHFNSIQLKNTLFHKPIQVKR